MPLALQNELSVSLLLLTVWVLEKVVDHLKSSPLLGSILAGILLGPALFDIIPFSQAMKLLGQLGVFLLVIDSGLAVDLECVRRYSIRAFAIALVGVILPVSFTLLLYTFVFETSLELSLAIGASLAPTSLGFSAQLLKELGQLNTPTGQLICTAAVLDDVLSLLLLTEINSLHQTTINFSDFNTIFLAVKPALMALGSIAVGAIFCVAISTIKRKVKPNPLDAAIILISSSCAAFICAWINSSALLGAFLIGLAFSTSLDAEKNAIRSQWRPFVSWGTRLFFACTVAFEVPSFTTNQSSFINLSTVWRTLLLMLCAIIGKLLAGLLVIPPFTCRRALQLGWAMNGRGEFSFLIATKAASAELIDRNGIDFAALILALLACTAIAPFAFRSMMPNSEHSTGKVTATCSPCVQHPCV